MYKTKQKGQYLQILLSAPQTVFSVQEIAMLWREFPDINFRNRLSFYVREGKLKRIYRGIYVKDENYNRFELATKIYSPCYISFETVLTREGLNFQYYNTIFVVSYLNRELVIDRQKIKFIKMKDPVLMNPLGIKMEEQFSIASKERAFLDQLYNSPNYYFDYLGVLNWDKVFEILPIYNNKRMNKEVKKYFKNSL